MNRLVDVLKVAVLSLVLVSGMTNASFAAELPDSNAGAGASEAGGLKEGGVDNCYGEFPNLLTDICWTCMFPIQVGSIKLSIDGQRDNGDPPPPLLCACPAPPPLFIRPGIGVSFWMPTQMVEVVREPMCSPTLGGIKLGDLNVPRGKITKDGSNRSFYQVHHFTYPVLSWLGMSFTSQACMRPEPFEMGYISEIDPLWDNEELSFLLNPEAVLVANPLAQGACIADAVKANAVDFGFDKLFWCSGSQGSVYPLSGNTTANYGGVDASLNTVHKFMFKLHRQGLANDTSTSAAMCMPQPQLMMRKNQYKQQMIHPLAQADKGYGFGKSSMLWGSGKEFPYKGEDFAYLLWEKQKCCAL